MKRRATIVLLVLAPLLLAFGCKNLTLSNSSENGNANVLANTFVNIPLVNQNRNVSQTNTTQVDRLPEEEELQRLASAFAERYGSYSNQTDFANLEALLFFMTPSFASETEAFVARERAKDRDTSIYYGLTTRTVSVTTQTYDEVNGRAAFLVSTQRKEAIGTTGNARTYQQELLIAMVRERGAWKVSDATWQN